MTAVPDRPLFTSHALTDVGRSRRDNEDNFFHGRTIFAVADGMGGHVHGEIASDMAVRPLEEIDGRTFDSPAEAEEALVEAIRQANETVVARSTSERELRGMGSTLTAVMVREGRLHVAHVGDSRAYLFRPQEGMSQLTTDHTLVEQLVRDGRLSRDEIATHPQRSVITRAIGVEATVQVDSLPPIALEPGDQVLLCSDGLSGPVDDQEIAEILARAPDGDSACRALIAAANRHGGPDNITVVLLRVGTQDTGETTVRQAAPVSGEEAAEAPTVRREPADGDTAGGAAPNRVVAGAPRSGVDTLDAPRQTAAHTSAPAEAEAVALVPPTEPAPDARRGRLVSGLRIAVVLLGLVLLGAATAGVGYLVLSRSYYLGVDGDEVVIFTGTNQEVAGVPLYRVAERTGVSLDDLPVRRQQLVRDGVPEPTLQDARASLTRYQDEAEAEQTPTSAPSPSPSTPTGQPPLDQGVPPPSDPAPAPAP